MLNLFRFIGARNLLSKPLRTLLTAVGVALGIALFAAIQIINRSTLESFESSVQAISGKATLVVHAGDAGFPDSKVEAIKKIPGVLHAVPMIQNRAFYAENNSRSETLVILGVDLLKEQAVRTYKTTDDQVIDDPLVFLNQPDSLIVTHAFAKAHGLALDSPLTLSTARGVKKFTVRGLLSPAGPAKAYGGALAIMDIDGAQFTFGKEGKLDRVDVVTTPGEEIDAVAARLREALGGGYFVEKPETQSEDMQRMVKSFQAMLSFFSSFALLVGLFLVTNSVSISVAERRKEIGTLRALGATRSGILTLILSEAVVIGSLGALLGSWLGRGLASLLVGMVTHSLSTQTLRTIDIPQLQFGPSQVITAIALGAAVALLAALFPAYRATQIEPIEAMREQKGGDERANSGFFKWSPYVAVLLLVYYELSSIFHIGVKSALLGNLEQACSVLGPALIGPALVRGALLLFRPWATRGRDALTRLAQDNVLRSPKRTGSNIMSLMVGLILVTLIAIVNQSFNTTILSWIERVFRADLLVSAQGEIASLNVQPLHESFGEELAKIPGVDTSFNGGRHALRFVHITYGGKQLALKATDEVDPRKKGSSFDLIDRDWTEASHDLFHSPDPTVFVSENFRLHFAKSTGDSIELPTPSGAKQFRIAGVLRDYASQEGVIYLSRDLYKKFWNDSLVSLFGIQVAEGFDPQTVRQAIDQKYGQAMNLTIVSFAELKAEMQHTIQRSFAYTRAIEAAALLVGLLGLVNTLLVSVMERTRELGMLRAVGMSRKMVARMVLQESLIQGGLGAVAAVILGSWIAHQWIQYSLAHVMGWVIQFDFPWTSIFFTLLIGIGVALTAGLLPARQAVKNEITEALQYE